jgi:hypothetical protein
LRDEVLQLRQTQQDLSRKIDDAKLVLMSSWFLRFDYYIYWPCS